MGLVALVLATDIHRLQSDIIVLGISIQFLFTISEGRY